MAILNYGTLDKYNALSTKDDKALYFLDNGQLYKGAGLISNVHTIEGNFPEITDEMRENYYISLKTGEIKYVTLDKKYINISQLSVESIVLNSDFIQKLIAEMAKTNSTYVTMPTLVVDGTVLEWTASNVESFTAITTS